MSCAGCDHISNSRKVFDACNVCGGDNSSCAGCDGIPNSGLVNDRCGVCNGDGSICAAEIQCSSRKNCNQCNAKVGGSQYCIWCDTTSSCHDISLPNLSTTCPNVSDTCPKEPEVEIPPTFTQNEEKSSFGAIAGGIGGALMLGGAIAGGLFMSQKKRAALLFDTSNWANTATNNPLYQDRTIRFDNPFYRPPDADAIVEED
jgi:hypothetical protein